MKTKLHSYSFNVGNIPDHQAYNLLRITMAEQSRRRDPVTFLEGGPTSGSGFGHLLLLGSPTHNHSVYEVDLDPKHLFDDQWNTVERDGHSGYRVFDWVEYISPHSRNIERGHWLEVTDEMVKALQKTLVCGYCGALYGPIHEDHLTAPRHVGGHLFCKKCLGSSYLKEEELPLLRLLPVSESRARVRQDLTEEESEGLMPRYVEAQLRSAEERKSGALEKMRAKVAEELETASIKAAGMNWLLDHGINLDLVIFYNHTKLFSFGWRSPLSPAVAAELRVKLEDFPFKTKLNISDK